MKLLNVTVRLLVCLGFSLIKCCRNQGPDSSLIQTICRATGPKRSHEARRIQCFSHMA